MGRAAIGWQLRKRGNSPYWRARFTVGGERFEISTGETNKAAANRAAQKIYSEKNLHTPVRQLGGDLGELLALWLEDRPKTAWHPTLQEYASFWADLWPDIDTANNEQTIARYISERLREVEAGTVRKELSGLSQFLKWAKRNGYVAQLATWDAPKDDPGDEYEARCLSPEDMTKLLAKLPEQGRRGEPLRAYYRFMWETAFRQGTMSRLDWKSIDLDAGLIKLPAKADKRRYARPVPLSVAALEILRQWPDRSGLVWGARRYGESLKKAARDAGLGDEGIHDRCIRHSAITHAASHTRDLLALMHFAGHRNMQTTSKYLHPSLARTQEMIASRPDIGALGDE